MKATKKDNLVKRDSRGRVCLQRFKLFKEFKFFWVREEKGEIILRPAEVIKHPKD